MLGSSLYALSYLLPLTTSFQGRPDLLPAPGNTGTEEEIQLEEDDCKPGGQRLC